MNECPICGSKKIDRKVISETLRGITFDDYVVWECPDCGESIVDHETLKRTGKVLKEATDES